MRCQTAYFNHIRASLIDRSTRIHSTLAADTRYSTVLKSHFEQQQYIMLTVSHFQCPQMNLSLRAISSFQKYHYSRRPFYIFAHFEAVLNLPTHSSFYISLVIRQVGTDLCTLTFSVCFRQQVIACGLFYHPSRIIFQRASGLNIKVGYRLDLA